MDETNWHCKIGKATFKDGMELTVLESKSEPKVRELLSGVWDFINREGCEGIGIFIIGKESNMFDHYRYPDTMWSSMMGMVYALGETINNRWNEDR